MKYQFPRISYIQDVLPAIKDDPNFRIVEKDGYTVINYVVAGTDTFPEVTSDHEFCDGCHRKRTEIDMCGSQRCPDLSNHAAIRRECRGIIFCSETGRLLRRPYHKFFNLGERTETLPGNVDFSAEHIIMDKLDGSMIAPFMLKGEMRWGTKMGLTDISAEVEEWVKFRPDYIEATRELFELDCTPIFEWCSPTNQIVLRHPQPRLRLTAVRNMTTGEYEKWPRVHFLNYYNYNLDVCYVWKGTVTDIEAFAEHTRGETDKEGYVIRFMDGHMVKVKSEWYCNIHKIKEQINSERSILELYFSNGLDDALAMLSAEERLRITTYTKAFEVATHLSACNIREIYEKVRSGTKKDFALGIAKTIPAIHKDIIYKHFDFPNDKLGFTENMVRERVVGSLGNNKNFLQVKEDLFKEVVY